MLLNPTKRDALTHDPSRAHASARPGTLTVWRPPLLRLWCSLGTPSFFFLRVLPRTTSFPPEVFPRAPSSSATTTSSPAHCSLITHHRGCATVALLRHRPPRTFYMRRYHRSSSQLPPLQTLNSNQP
jgi:hypothetical protein